MNILMLQDISSLKPGVLAGPYMGNSPLWSLSYEWWFYILYFPIVRFIKKSDVFVFILASCSAVVYCFWPYFLQRLFMYFSIWWTGVYVSKIYLNGDREYTLNKLFYPLITLSLISVVLFTNCLASYFSDNLSSFGVHPILEFRHFVFSVFVVLFSIGWMRLSLFGFDYILKPFSLLAPISYGIYISHYYLVSNADYFAFVGNKFVEWVGYMVVVIVFSYVLEVVVYPRVLGAVSNFHGK